MRSALRRGPGRWCGGRGPVLRTWCALRCWTGRRRGGRGPVLRTWRALRRGPGRRRGVGRPVCRRRRWIRLSRARIGLRGLDRRRGGWRPIGGRRRRVRRSRGRGRLGGMHLRHDLPRGWGDSHCRRHGDGARLRHGLTDRLDVERPSGILLQGSLLGREGNRRRRRRLLRYHLHAYRACGRVRGWPIAGHGSERLSHRRDGRRDGHVGGNLRHLVCRNRNTPSLLNRPAAGERGLRHGHHRVGRSHIREVCVHVYISHILIHVYVVVHVGNVHRIYYCGVGYVHSSKVSLTHLIGRSVDFARP